MTPERIAHLTDVYRRGLLEDVLPFWIKHAVDREHGGFTVAVDRDGSVLDTDKAVWAQCRFTWLLGEWYGYLHRDGRVSVPLKANLWKGPFHLPRMQLVCLDILGTRDRGQETRD